MPPPPFFKKDYMGLFINLKRNKIWADIYHKGEKIMTIRVSDHNRGVSSVIDLDAGKDVVYKIIKDINNAHLLADETFFNQEKFNK